MSEKEDQAAAASLRFQATGLAAAGALRAEHGRVRMRARRFFAASAARLGSPRRAKHQ